MTTIHCIKKKCLNHKDGYCTAAAIEYDGLCQTYITSKNSSRVSVGICHRDKGKLKRNYLEMIK